MNVDVVGGNSNFVNFKLITMLLVDGLYSYCAFGYSNQTQLSFQLHK